MRASRLALIVCCCCFSASFALARGAVTIIWPKPLEAFKATSSRSKSAATIWRKSKGAWARRRFIFTRTGTIRFPRSWASMWKPNRRLAKLRVKAKSPGGAQRQTEIQLKIKAKSFHQESFNVPPSFDQMSPETLAEIRREQEAFARVFATTATERFWESPFIRPVPQEASASSFGSRRIINGVAARTAQRHGSLVAGGNGGCCDQSRQGRPGRKFFLRRRQRRGGSWRRFVHDVFSSLRDQGRRRSAGEQRRCAGAVGRHGQSDRDRICTGARG